MLKKTVYIFCDEKELQEEAERVMISLEADLPQCWVVFCKSARQLAWRLNRRKNQVELVVLYKKRVNEAVDLLAGPIDLETSKRPEAAIMVQFEEGQTYLEEFHALARRLERQKMLALLLKRSEVEKAIEELIACA